MNTNDSCTLFASGLSTFENVWALLTVLTLTVAASPIQAQTTDARGSLEKVLVTATQKPISESLTGSAVTVITEEDIDQKQAIRVPELLRSVPGVSVSRSGSLGGKTSVRIRGLDSKYTQVLVNGVRVNDSTSPDGAYDFSTFNTDNIKRIEIVRGNQSVLHGSDAIGGVINIITREGTEELNANATVENGSFGTRRVSTEVSGSVEAVRFSTSLSRYETDGISAAASGSERDGYENRTLSTRLSAPISTNWSVSSFLRVTDAFTETDAFGPTDDPNQSQDIGESVGSVKLESTGDAPLQQSLRASWFDVRRSENNPFGAEYEGDRDHLEYQASYEFNANHAVSGTTRYENEGAEISSGLDNDFTTLSAAGEYQYTPGDWMHTLGLRGLDHEEFGSHATGRLTTAYFTKVLANLLGGEETKLRASYGTGFNVPTAYQLYNNQPFIAVGNPDLDPETSQGGDVGFEHYVNESDHVSLTYFRNEVEDQFGFRLANPAGEPDYFNRSGTTETEGFESSVHVEPMDRISLDLTYTHQSSEDPSGNDIDLIPENKASGTIEWKATESLNLSVNGEFNDERPDGAVTLEEYELVNTTARYTISSGSTAFVRLENAFDEAYQEVDGFGTAGRGAYGGVSMTF